MTDVAMAETSTLVNPDTELAHTSPESAPLVPGRRDFFNYRDLGVTKASGGRMRAQVTVATGTMRPTGWHYHVCDSQFVYALKGWVDLAFEDGRTIRVKAGDALFIPGGLKHNEIGMSEDLEILEVSVPAEMGTKACDPPAGMKG
jgi:quercetin dioxygenase-like cupin family protein